MKLGKSSFSKLSRDGSVTSLKVGIRCDADRIRSDAQLGLAWVREGEYDSRWRCVVAQTPYIAVQPIPCYGSIDIRLDEISCWKRGIDMSS